MIDVKLKHNIGWWGKNNANPMEMYCRNVFIRTRVYYNGDPLHNPVPALCRWRRSKHVCSVSGVEFYTWSGLSCSIQCKNIFRLAQSWNSSSVQTADKHTFSLQSVKPHLHGGSILLGPWVCWYITSDIHQRVVKPCLCKWRIHLYKSPSSEYSDVWKKIISFLKYWIILNFRNPRAFPSSCDDLFLHEKKSGSNLKKEKWANVKREEVVQSVYQILFVTKRGSLVGCNKIVMEKF